ncbi:MAG: Rid family detoxifying hydrolase [Candidatus Hodarchaeales archaeon]|jgi:2-iminobutanoate/2-iminopropanoate deaminase
MEFINSEKAPKAIGAYSQATKVGKFIFTSGNIGIDLSSKLKETLGNQTKQTLENLRQILISAGADLDKVVKTTIFLGVDIIENFAEVNQIYASFMGDHKPARSFVQVVKLPLNAKIMIEMIAET